MKIKHKLSWGFGLMAVLVLMVALLALRSLSREHEQFERYSRELGARLALAHQLEDAANARAIGARNLVLVADATQRETERQAVLAAHEAVGRSLSQLKALLAAQGEHAAGEQRFVADIEQVEQAYGPVALGIARLAMEGRHDEAVRRMNEDCRPLLARLTGSVGAYVRHGDEQAAEALEQAEAAYATSRAVMLAACALAMLLAAALAWAITRAVTVPIGTAVRVAQSVAAGDLGTPIDARRQDEPGQLLQSLATMRDNLVSLVSEVRRNAEGVAAASTQIAHGNHDLSRRTEQQAAALQQTAASMDELGSTVRHNADSALQADGLAQAASGIATQGGAAVAQVVQTMRGLEDSSRRIGEIIGVVDGIAFQTNILALNAAVEAARAGEHGRGFAVVAGEVRSLAQRCAEAAKDVRALIDDSVSRVAQGTAQADRAGATMAEVQQAVSRVTALMGEINNASAEQSRGMAQVGQAVNQMDQATQQNAALVEQSAAAAASLRQQAQRLVQAVAVFRLGSGQAA